MFFSLQMRAQTRLAAMGDWYWIGVCAGLGVGIGVLLAGFLAGTRAALTGVLILAAGLGVAVGFGIGEWDEAIGGGAGGTLGAIGAAQLVAGTLRRGGARFRTAGFLRPAAHVPAPLPWDPGGRLPRASLPPPFP